jgi:hypothetical protein
MEDHGYHPLSKFSSARDDILHFLCISDWAEESDGNSEAPTGYFWRISNTDADVHQSNGEFSSVFAEWLEMNPEVTDSPELRSELVGHFIVQAMDSGFVYVGDYSTEEAMLEDFAEMQEEFGKWDEQDLED